MRCFFGAFPPQYALRGEIIAIQWNLTASSLGGVSGRRQQTALVASGYYRWRLPSAGAQTFQLNHETWADPVYSARVNKPIKTRKPRPVGRERWCFIQASLIIRLHLSALGGIRYNSSPHSGLEMTLLRLAPMLNHRAIVLTWDGEQISSLCKGYPNGHIEH